jgi:acyl transferase domain-containing protein
MQALGAGTMIAVGVEESEAAVLAGGELSVAAVNGPQQCVLSGATEAVGKLEEFLTAEGISHRRLKTSHAFHSKMLDPMIDGFREEIRSIELKEPQRRYLSNVTGSWITRELATDPEYWLRQIRHTVRFSQGLQELLLDPRRIFLEVGPGQTLTRMVRQQVKGATSNVLSSTFSGEMQDSGMEVALGNLWLAGALIDWSRFHARNRCRRVSLPRYPFQRQRYWIEPEVRLVGSSQSAYTPAEPARHSEQDHETNTSAISQSDGSLDGQATLHDRPLLRNPYVAPTTSEERTIAQLCQEALGIKEVGVDDNFFELGGDSLTALRVVADVKKHFGVEIPAISIYESLTIRGLAQLIVARADPEQDAEPASATQQRLSRMERRRHRLQRESNKQTATDLV